MYIHIKRIIDFILSLIAIIVLSPLFLVLALWIKFDSQGPVFSDKNGLELIVPYKVIPNTAGELFEIYDESKEINENGTFIIGFSGRYTDWKNWPLALDIIDELDYLIGDKLEVRMAVGTLDKKAELDTNNMFAELHQKLGKRFVGKINITLEEMDSFYYELDLFILTSKPHTESFGRTIVEAMSRKTAVISTNAGGAEEVVGSNSNIFSSFEGIVERAHYLFNNRESLEFEKKNNLNRVKEKYSLNNNIKKHIELYDLILEFNTIEAN